MKKVSDIINDCSRKERSVRLHVKGVRLCVPEVFSALVNSSELNSRDFWGEVALGASVHWPSCQNETEHYRVTCAYMLRGLSLGYPLPDVVDSKDPWGVTEIALLSKTKFTIPNYLYVPLKRQMSARRLAHEVSHMFERVSSELGRRQLFVSKATISKKIHIMLMGMFLDKEMTRLKVNI